MTVLSAQTIQRMGIISPCNPPYQDRHGRSAGLSACGVDLTLRDPIHLYRGQFLLAVAAEYFSIPSDVVRIIHDKSSLARRGLAVQNTVAEPGWRGYLTLELSNHGEEIFHFEPGAAICQVIFHRLDEPTERPYAGRYQDAGPFPQEAL